MSQTKKIVPASHTSRGVTKFVQDRLNDAEISVFAGPKWNLKQILVMNPLLRVAGWEMLTLLNILEIQNIRGRESPRLPRDSNAPPRELDVHYELGLHRTLQLELLSARWCDRPG